VEVIEDQGRVGQTSPHGGDVAARHVGGHGFDPGPGRTHALPEGLERNPLKGYKVPKEKSPLRVKLSDEEYQALLGVAKELDWRFYVALVLAHETRHRIGAVRQLRWSDIDFEGQRIRWRAETEKTGYAHVTPMTPEASAVLQFARTPALYESVKFSTVGFVQNQTGGDTSRNEVEVGTRSDGSLRRI